MRGRLLLSALLVLVGCGQQQPLGAPSTDTASPSVTATVAKSPTPCNALEGGSDSTFMLLNDVRVAAHEGFDRVVFEFKPGGRGDPAIPKYTLKTARPPFTKDPSGEPMQVEGTHFFALNLQGASGVDLSGTEYRQVYTGPKEFKDDLEVIVELEEAGDFEATINWVIGLNADSCPTVATTSNPYRLIIDLPHGE